MLSLPLDIVPSTQAAAAEYNVSKDVFRTYRFISSFTQPCCVTLNDSETYTHVNMCMVSGFRQLNDKVKNKDMIISCALHYEFALLN